MAYKVFTNGSVLNASEVNDNLMNQAVITFTNSTARASAITSPVEGMVTYLADTDNYQFWNGSAWTNLVSSTVGTGNAIINGAFEINQRNFSTTTTDGAFGFDRWFMSRGGTSVPTVTYSSQALTPGTAPVAGYNGTNFARMATTTGSSANEYVILGQKVEDIRSLAGQTLTVSFWAKAASGTPKLGIELEANAGSGGSGATSAAGQSVTTSTAWTRYSVTITTPSLTGVTIGTGSAYALNFWTSGGSTFNTRSGSVGNQTATIDIWGVQVEAGSTATAFRRNGSNIGEELASCQRYFVRFQDGAFNAAGTGPAAFTTLVVAFLSSPVTMRVPPTSITTSGMGLHDPGTGDVAITSITLDSSSSRNYFSVICNTAGGLTAKRVYILRGGGTGSPFIDFSAEL